MTTATTSTAADPIAHATPIHDTVKPWQDTWLSGPEGHQFYTRTYTIEEGTTPQAVILFVHGFAEHIGRYEHVHVDYPKKGIVLFAFDQRGFGRTALDTEKRSKGSAYAKTSWKWQLEDIEFWVQHLAKEYPGIPLFLMGHSMGGGLALAFVTRTIAPPEPESVKLLSGVIASSPLVRLTNPKPKVVRWAGGKISNFLPFMTIPVDLPVEHLSRNPAANQANLDDPLIKRIGSLKGLDDMLTGGEGLVEEHYQYWPKDLPVLFVQGTEDKVTSYKSTQEFYGKISADDKRISLYEGGYHELVHDVDGLPERLFDECSSWITDHLGKKSAVPESKL